MARGKRESGVARGADLWTKGGDYQRPLQGQKTVWFARERKVRPEGEEGELRDKKAAASRCKLFLSLARQGMDSARDASKSLSRLHDQNSTITIGFIVHEQLSLTNIISSQLRKSFVYLSQSPILRAPQLEDFDTLPLCDIKSYD